MKGKKEEKGNAQTTTTMKVKEANQGGNGDVDRDLSLEASHTRKELKLSEE